MAKELSERELENAARTLRTAPSGAGVPEPLSELEPPSAFPGATEELIAVNAELAKLPMGATLAAKLAEKGGLDVAVVGATGAVGRQMVDCLAERDFPLSRLRVLGSSRTAGERYPWQGNSHLAADDLTLEEGTAASIAGADLILGAASNDLALSLYPKAAEAGAIVVDNSSAFRLLPEVPLVVPEINAADVARSHGIIANPNCATIICLVAVWPLAEKAGLISMVVSTYQAASGAGRRGMEELVAQEAALALGEPVPAPSAFPYQLGLNLIPQIGGFDGRGYTSEEMKLQNEGRKIMHLPELRVGCTCVRVPVMRSHAESVALRLEEPLTPAEARELLRDAPGVKLVDEPAVEPPAKRYPMPLDTSDQDLVYVGRIREDLGASDPSRALALWCCGDQIRKGAASNTVQIAELLLK